MIESYAKRTAMLSLLTWFGLVLSVTAQEPESPLAALRRAESAIRQLIETAEPSVVAVQMVPAVPGVNRSRTQFSQPPDQPFGNLQRLRNVPQPTTTGAGVVIGSDGLVLTQFLAIRPGQQHQIATTDGKTYPVKIKAADPRSGLAVLEANTKDLPAIPIGRAETLRKGSFVVVIGNPFAIAADGQPSASTGTVVNIGRKAANGVPFSNDSPGAEPRATLHHFGTLIQTDAKLGWNGAGGALIDAGGKLVGVTTTAATTAGHEQPAGYAIPLNETFRRVVDTLSEGKEVEYGMLGISFNPTSVSDSRGVQVKTSFAGGPAARAGLRPGDRITAIAGQPILTTDDLQLTVGSQPPNTPIPVAFTRNGSPRETSVQLAKYYVPGVKIVTAKRPAWRGLRVDYSTAIPAQQLLESSQLGWIDPEGCVAVVEVAPQSVSWKRGIRRGMFITHVGDERVTTPKEFWDAVKNSDESVELRWTGGTTSTQEIAKPPAQPQFNRLPRGRQDFRQPRR